MLLFVVTTPPSPDVIVFNEEKSRGECTTSAGEGLLDSITKL